MRRGLISASAYLGVAVLLTAAVLLLIEPQTNSSTSAAAPQGKGGAIKPAPTATSAGKKAKPPEGKKPKSNASKISDPGATAKSNAQQPSLTISAFQSLGDYDSSLRDNVYTIVIPNLNANAVSVKSGSVLLKNGSRGTGFDNLQLDQRGKDSVVSFSLQPGAYARISRRTLERFEKLEVFILLTKPENATSGVTPIRLNENVGTGNANDTNSRHTNAVSNKPASIGTLRMPEPNEGSKNEPPRIDGWPKSESRTSTPKPEAGLLIPYSQDGRSEQFVHTKGKFSEISGKRKVIVNAGSPAQAERITDRLREYGGLEIVKTVGEAEFAVNVTRWSYRDNVFMGIEKTFTGGSFIVTIRDTSLPVPCIIWRHTEDGGDDAFDKLAKRFIRDLKKLRGEK